MTERTLRLDELESYVENNDPGQSTTDSSSEQDSASTNGSGGGVAATPATADSDTTSPEEDTEDEPSEPEYDIEALREETSSPDLDGIDVEHMDLGPFPDPEEIVAVVDDTKLTAGTKLPDPDDLDPENGIFLCMDAEEVMEYLETLQKKTDHWLNNEIKYNIQRQLIGQSHGYTEDLKLSHYDKKWLAYTEKERRMEADDYEWKAVPDSRGWQPLPNAPDAPWNGNSADDSPTAAD